MQKSYFCMEQKYEIMKGSKTVVWNGPMGVFEMPN